MHLMQLQLSVSNMEFVGCRLMQKIAFEDVSAASTHNVSHPKLASGTFDNFHLLCFFSRLSPLTWLPGMQ